MLHQWINETAGASQDLGAHADESEHVSCIIESVTTSGVIHKVEWSDSQEARRANPQGTVRLEAEVWEDSPTYDFRVIRGLDPRTDKNAVKASK